MMRIVAVVAAVLLMAACGGGGGDAEVVSVSEPSTSTTRDGTDAPDDDGRDTDDDTDDEAEALAEAGLLQIGDFEAGWRAEADDGDAEDDDDSPDLAEECNLEAPESEASADSPTFTRNDAEVSNQVGVFADADAAEEAITAFGSPEVQACIEDLFVTTMQEELAGDVEASDAIDSLDVSWSEVPVPAYGDDTLGYRVQVDVALTDGASIAIYIDLIVAREGRAVAMFSFFDVLTPFDGDVDGLVEASLDRLTAAS